MNHERIQQWPRGVRPVFFATPGAWELLELVRRQDLSAEDLLGRMALYSKRDLRGAYALATGSHSVEGRRDPLVDDGARDGTSRIRALLRRAFDVLQVDEELVLLKRRMLQEVQALVADPPRARGVRVRSPLACLLLAAKERPLDVLLRHLFEIRPQDLLAAQARLRCLAPRGFIRGRWPGTVDRQRLDVMLEMALELHQQVGERKLLIADAGEPVAPVNPSPVARKPAA